jgi:ABC-type Na+ transport system ATPase subunit NatA
MKIVSHEELQMYRDENTREVDLPDGSKRKVRMTEALWQSLECVLILDHLTTADISAFALEELTLQDVTFDRAFRGVVALLANRWR